VTFGESGGGADGFAVRVTVTGLLSTGLTLTLNDGLEQLVVDGAGEHAFATRLADGESFSVTAASPPGEDCVVDASGMGQVAGADVQVGVTCTPVVVPVHAAAADWNAYVAADGTSPCDAEGVAHRRGCIHGGEQRMLLIPGTSCEGVTASDTLDAFEWICDESTMPLRVRTPGLKRSRGLRTLIQTGENLGWIENTVTVESESGPLVASTPSVWWANPVVADDDGGSLNVPGTVYVVGAEVPVTLDSDSVALLVTPGIALTADSEDVVSADGRNFLWIEGAIGPAQRRNGERQRGWDPAVSVGQQRDRRPLRPRSCE
jgi:hypothetical protein